MIDEQYIPEKALVFDVIKRAIEDALGRYKILSTDTRQIQREAEAWIFSLSIQPWSFKWCCDQVDIDFKLIRKFIKKHKCQCPRGKGQFCKCEPLSARAAGSAKLIHLIIDPGTSISFGVGNFNRC